mmetsp:Transcript_7909/g.28068  ORF Transcript_7909/g.28068 Transcript_7909/m.28068 type:complete len:197 (-) Transcript_7909:908-1498(-)
MFAASTEGRAGDHLPVRYPRPAATARLEHDAATLLVGIEREPATAIEKICADVKELGVLAKTWATGYVTETHAKSLKRAQEARDAYAPAAVRAAVDRVAPQLDAVFKGVVDACLAGPVPTVAGAAARAQGSTSTTRRSSSSTSRRRSSRSARLSSFSSTLPARRRRLRRWSRSNRRSSATGPAVASTAGRMKPGPT